MTTTAAAPTAPRTWASREEVCAAYALWCERHGLRYYRNKADNLAAFYDHLRMRDATAGHRKRSSNTTQAARDLYIDVAELLERQGVEAARAQAHKKHASIQRWRDLLAEMGLISVRRRPGKGFDFRLLPVPADVARMAAQRGCSSVGWTVTRARLSLEQLRSYFVRKWRRRAGRWPARPFFCAPRFDQARALAKARALQAADAHARGVPPPAVPSAASVGVERGGAGLGGVVDALGRACPPGQRSALESLRAKGSEGGNSALRAAGYDGAPWSALALALWALRFPELEPRFSRQTSEQLERSAEQLCRLWSRRDVVDRLVDSLSAEHFYGDEPRTLRYFVLPLKQSARQARRHARGAPAPRPWRHRGRA